MNNDEVKKLKIVSGIDLQNADLPQINFIVKDMLPEGLAILAGEPKSGKSWLALQLACAIINGDKFLDKETNESECLYLALEDSYNRLQNRLNIILNNEGITEGLFLDINCNRLDNGLIMQLTNVLKEHPNIKLIIIDTLQLIRGSMNKNSTLYENDYKDLSILKKFADANHITILLIHHFRKAESDDIFDRFSGSNGIIGVADTIFALDRKKKKDNEAIFTMSGRDIESEELILQLNRINNSWKLKGTVDEIEKENQKDYYSSNPLIITINKLIEDSLEKSISLTASELLEKVKEITGITPKEQKPNGVTRSLNKLKLEMLKYDGIYYEPPPTNGGANGRNMYFCKTNRQKDNL